MLEHEIAETVGIVKISTIPCAVDVFGFSGAFGTAAVEHRSDAVVAFNIDIDRFERNRNNGSPFTFTEKSADEPGTVCS